MVFHPSFSFFSSGAINGLTFNAHQGDMKSTEEISCHTVWFCKSGWKREREREIYNLRKKAVVEANPTLYPPRAESQSCISCDITPRPAAAPFPTIR